MPRPRHGPPLLGPRPRVVRRKDRPRLTALARLLVCSRFAFNTGFYAVLPHLADHLSSGLGLGGPLVDLVLGLRTFSQQGMFVVGGALTDRYGPRPLVLVGCALRVAGFGWLAYAAAAWSVIGSVMLIGFAAALFSPAVESEIAREALRIEQAGAPARTRVLAKFFAGGQAGALIGPVLGAALLYGRFRTACLAGAAVFTLVLAGHARLMPHGAPHVTRSPLTPSPALTHRRFLLLALAYSAYLLAYNQLYLALPAELDRATGSQAALGWLFALSSALVVFGQMPLERLATVRLGLAWPAMIQAGLLLLGAAFVVLLTLGQMLVVPAARAGVTALVAEERLGLFTGALSSVSGLVVLAGSVPVGALLDTDGPAPWLILATVPVPGLLLIRPLAGGPRPGEDPPRLTASAPVGQPGHTK
ncbi:MFS transporter [Streptomyces sp. NPDC001732]